MSYDIYLKRQPSPCPTCGREGGDPEVEWGPTYNLTPIFDLALTGEPMPNPDVNEARVVLFHEKTDRPRGLRVLSGRRAGDTIEALRKAVGHLHDAAKEDAFQALAPSNGWGTLQDARDVMCGLLKLAHENPDCVWEIR